MRQFGFFWGVLGVLGILLLAVMRLTPYILDLSGRPLGPLHWSVLLAWTVYMAYAEGYKGFHLAFAPRVVARADFLRRHRRPFLSLLAPLFCMGYFHATRRRIITSLSITAAIVILVLIVRTFPQPWRGIVDTGVVGGLLLGAASIVFYATRVLTRSGPLPCSADLPSSEVEQIREYDLGK